MAIKAEKRKQYFVAIIPPSPVFEEALKLKEYFKEKYGSKAALNSPPHVTLHMPFLWNEKKEKKLITKLQDFSRRCDPLKVCLDNFSSFPPRVIFINVAESDALDELQKRLHRFFKRELDIFNANYKEQPYHPHLTLAFRDLKKAQYHLAWEEFSKKELKAEFMADKIALLKHNGKSWDVLKEFLLESSYSTESNPELKTTEG
ncbi:MAG: 2'-5' RNA ligase family protein [Cyclobacteriaceae bacterium]